MYNNNNRYIIDTDNTVNDWYLDNALNIASTFEPTLHTSSVLSDWLTNFNN